MTAIFVTGTGTDVGKTFVTTGLIRHLRTTGRPVEALKPVVSGFDPDAPATSDPGLLLAALDRALTQAEIDRISPWRFRAPLSPDLAAAREGRNLDYKRLVEFSRQAILAAKDVLLVEGIGGIMVPLDDRHTVLDWMTVLRIPVILVAGSYLGTISHTLTALHVLAQRNVEVSSIVVSESQGSSTPLPDTIATIRRFAVPIEVIGIPRLPDCHAGHPAFEHLVKLL
jgi:dethiobiotin synthetase